MLRTSLVGSVAIPPELPPPHGVGSIHAPGDRYSSDAGCSPRSGVGRNLQRLLSWDPAFSANCLLWAWASDRAKAYERRYPIPEEGLGEGEKAVLHAVRVCWFRYHGGSITTVCGTDVRTLKRYLESGRLPVLSNRRLAFLNVLESVLRDSFGRGFLRGQLGRRFVGEYWRPSHIRDVDSISAEAIEGLFQAVAAAKGFMPRRIVWQYLLRSSRRMASPTPVAEGEENRSRGWAKITYERVEEGDYGLVAARGLGASPVVHRLRSLESVPSFLRIRSSDGFLGLRVLRLDEDLEDLKKEDLKGWFREVASRRGGQPPRRIIWQFILMYGRLNVFTVLAEGEENPSKDYGKIIIEEVGEEKYRMIKKGGEGSQTVMDRLRSIPTVREFLEG